jgi:hypothetical protein
MQYFYVEYHEKSKVKFEMGWLSTYKRKTENVKRA